ncbi:MAG: hypothetical protein ABH914_02280, partial [Candidatus Omnitrophota bacterium]
KVWVTYGQAHAGLIDKYVTKPGIEVILQFLKSQRTFLIPARIKGFIYLGNLHMLFLSGLLLFLGVIFSWGLFNWLFIILCFFFGYRYVKWNFSMEPRSKFLSWCKLKYLTNLSFIKGGWKGFKTYKVLCIEPSF